MFIMILYNISLAEMLIYCMAYMRLYIVAKISQTASLGARSPRAPGWLELANDVFYLNGSAVFQCMEYH
jgi:hypothetical protein